MKGEPLKCNPTQLMKKKKKSEHNSCQLLTTKPIWTKFSVF
jgi:hypothetical protein